MAYLTSFFPSFFGGPKLITGSELLQLINALFSVAGSGAKITALAGGGAGGPGLNYAINTVATVASNNDSVTLPPAVAGQRVVVNNDGASTLAVWGNGTDTIVAEGSTSGSAATHATQLTGVCATYWCVSPGLWKQGAVT